MDNLVKDEAAKTKAVKTWGDLELQVDGEIVEWIKKHPDVFPTMQHACNTYWNERLN